MRLAWARHTITVHFDSMPKHSPASRSVPIPIPIPDGARPEKRKSGGMPCQDINVGGSGVLFELNKCQRRGETASKLTLHGAPIKLPKPPPAVVSQTLLYRICMSCQSDALKTQNINTLTPSFLSGCRKQTAQTHTNIAAETQILV